MRPMRREQRGDSRFKVELVTQPTLSTDHVCATVDQRQVERARICRVERAQDGCAEVRSVAQLEELRPAEAGGMKYGRKASRPAVRSSCPRFGRLLRTSGLERR